MNAQTNEQVYIEYRLSVRLSIIKTNKTFYIYLYPAFVACSKPINWIYQRDLDMRSKLNF